MYKGRTCGYCGAMLDACEKCDCEQGKRPCARCGFMVMSGDRCPCMERHTLLVIKSNGDRVATHINGKPDEIISYYRDNTTAKSILFCESGNHVVLQRKEAV